MKIGVVFPQTEFGHEASALKDYAQTAEGLGYDHILAYDHVLGANPDRPGGWNGPYTHETPFIEIFVLLSYFAAITERIELTSGILNLPQRQTALVAKQAATLDAISGGRLRLGVGLGWNQVEYEALNEDFNNRGRRVEEQAELLKALWAQPLVTFEGRWHHVSDAGLNPLPVRRSIPLWFGGHHENVLRRVAEWGEGWMPNFRMAAEAAGHLEQLAGYLEQADRSRQDVGLEARLHYKDGPDVWRQRFEEWQAAGATHITINTMGAGLQGPQAHIAAIREFMDFVGQTK